MMGTPSITYWNNLANLPDYKYSFPKWSKQPLDKFVPDMTPLGLDLLEKMLELNPDKRISAAAAL
jgi:serine/threonine protein kinase